MTVSITRIDDRPVFVGTRAEAIMMLRSLNESGRLLDWEQQPSPVPGRVVLRYRLAERSKRAPQRRRRVPRWVWVALAVTVLAVLGGVVWALWLALAWAAANVATLAGIGLATALIVALAAGGGTVVVTVIVRR